jgi:hypothetical protein
MKKLSVSLNAKEVASGEEGLSRFVEGGRTC